MKFIVMVTAAEGQEPEPVGPFPSSEWAERYVERVGRSFYRLVIMPLLSPRLIGPVDDSLTMKVLFDPEEGIDIQRGSRKEPA